jgi:3-phenylpropionate/cinnamic acid dioxygenase small subunit
VLLYEGGLPRTMHVLGNIEVELDAGGDTATARCTFTVLQTVTAGTLGPVLAGRYHDCFERVDGAWRLSERTVYPDLLGDLSGHMGRRARD